MRPSRRVFSHATQGHPGGIYQSTGRQNRDVLIIVYISLICFLAHYRKLRFSCSQHMKLYWTTHKHLQSEVDDAFLVPTSPGLIADRPPLGWHITVTSLACTMCTSEKQQHCEVLAVNCHRSHCLYFGQLAQLGPLAYWHSLVNNSCVNVQCCSYHVTILNILCSPTMTG